MTNSISFPAMFDVARNRVGVLEGNQSVVNRCRLLLLSDPTELYNSPNFGVGLRRYLWQYNTENVRAMMRDRIISQLEAYEPSCVADKTQFADNLLFTDKGEGTPSVQDYNTFKMTVGVQTVYGDKVEVDIDGNTK